MSKTILVTGAAGFIGSHLVDLLIRKGVSPRSLQLLIAPWDTMDNLHQHMGKHLNVIRADIRDRKAMLAATKNVNVIYHLAARIDFDGQHYKDYEDVNVTATQHLLDGAVKHGVKKFVFFSSIGVFGLPAGIGNINGWDETHAKTYTNHYGRSKWEGEKRVLAAHERHSLSYAIIRPASVYGPREKGPTLALFKAIKNHQFAMIGNGNNKMHYVYVEDLVQAAYLAATDKRTSGDYIIGGDQPTPFKQLVKEIADSIQTSIPPWHIPTSVALVLSYILDFVGKIVGVTPPLFPSRVKTMTTTYYYSIEKARRELGYKPAFDTKKGMALTGAWYRQNGWL